MESFTSRREQDLQHCFHEQEDILQMVQFSLRVFPILPIKCTHLKYMYGKLHIMKANTDVIANVCKLSNLMECGAGVDFCHWPMEPCYLVKLTLFWDEAQFVVG
jgi:hypothetical protein